MKNRVLMIVIAVLAIAAGIFCLANPLAGSLAAETFAGWSFLLLGILMFVAVFKETGWGGRIWTLAIAIMAILAGISLLANPLAGVITLAVTLAILFIISGLFKVVASFSLPKGSQKWMVLLSGVISLLLGGMILSDFPSSALAILGILLGIELIADGVWLLGLAHASKKLENAIQG